MRPCCRKAHLELPACRAAAGRRAPHLARTASRKCTPACMQLVTRAAARCCCCCQLLLLPVATVACCCSWLMALGQWGTRRPGAAPAPSSTQASSARAAAATPWNLCERHNVRGKLGGHAARPSGNGQVWRCREANPREAAGHGLLTSRCSATVWRGQRTDGRLGASRGTVAVARWHRSNSPACACMAPACMPAHACEHAHLGIFPSAKHALGSDMRARDA